MVLYWTNDSNNCCKCSSAVLSAYCYEFAKVLYVVPKE